MHLPKRLLSFKHISTFLLLFFVVNYAKAIDGKQTSKATLQTVTVYRNGAEMNQLAKADLIKGNNELIIENLSNAVDINSIRVSVNSSVTVMGLEYSTDYLNPEIKSASIRNLEDSIDRLNTDVEKIKTNLSITNDLLSVLKANKEIKGSQTGLSVNELIKLMDYYKLKSIEIQNEIAQLNQKQIKLLATIDKLNIQIEEEEKKNTKSTGKLILQLNCLVPGKYDFNLSYVSQNASWTPFYDIKAKDIKSPLKLIYKAKIYQTTGLDWKQVTLSLSTSSPSQTGLAPVFRAWFLSYINPINVYNQNLRLGMNRIQSFDDANNKQLSEVVVAGVSRKKSISGDLDYSKNDPIYIVNGVEMSESEFQKIDNSGIKYKEFLKAEDASNLYGSRAASGAVVVTLKDGLEDYISVADNELDVTFDIALPYDVPTNGKAQTATLTEYDVPATFKYYSVPKLDKEVFLLAEVADWEKLNLLPGEANIIFEDTYIGKSFIDPSSTQDTLNLTMGKDKRVVVKEKN
ncbi:MAG: mucoidy inhibitor MuiA family protein [Chitinophagaceae bacterium]|nr:mucoidy inhibitor MuiA family protein [Chitinophagaceae bacterium]